MCSLLRNVPALEIQAAKTFSCQLQHKPLATHRNLHLPIRRLQSLLQPLGAVCNCCPVYAADGGHVMFQSGPALHHNHLAKAVDQCTAKQQLDANNTGLTGTQNKPVLTASAGGDMQLSIPCSGM